MHFHVTWLHIHCSLYDWFLGFGLFWSMADQSPEATLSAFLLFVPNSSSFFFFFFFGLSFQCLAPVPPTFSTFHPISFLPKHPENPESIFFVPTPSAALALLTHSHPTADYSSVWIWWDSSLWKTMHTLYFSSRLEWNSYVMLSVPFGWKYHLVENTHSSWHQQAFKKHTFTFIW